MLGRKHVNKTAGGSASRSRNEAEKNVMEKSKLQRVAAREREERGRGEERPEREEKGKVRSYPSKKKKKGKKGKVSSVCRLDLVPRRRVPTRFSAIKPRAASRLLGSSPETFARRIKATLFTAWRGGASSGALSRGEGKNGSFARGKREGFLYRG